MVGTADTFAGIWAALRDEVTRTGSALGLAATDPDAWVAQLSRPRRHAGRALDHYVEAQLHGGLDLTTDVEAVVADPSFAGTPSARHLAALAPLRYHPGFVLPADEFPDDLRGPQAARLARRLGPELIDAAAIGAAAREPERFGPAAETRQLLKYLWHILVLRGLSPAGKDYDQ